MPWLILTDHWVVSAFNRLTSRGTASIRCQNYLNIISQIYSCSVCRKQRKVVLFSRYMVENPGLFYLIQLDWFDWSCFVLYFCSLNFSVRCCKNLPKANEAVQCHRLRWTMQSSPGCSGLYVSFLSLGSTLLCLVGFTWHGMNVFLALNGGYL
jgi:hypothetical protein